MVEELLFRRWKKKKRREGPVRKNNNLPKNPISANIDSGAEQWLMRNCTVLFDALVVGSLKSLVKFQEVWVEAKRQECIAKPRQGAFFNMRCYFRPQPLKKRIRIDIPGRDGPRIYVASSDDFEDVKEKLISNAATNVGRLERLKT